MANYEKAFNKGFNPTKLTAPAPDASPVKPKEKEAQWGIKIPNADTWLSEGHIIGFWNLETASQHLKALVKIGHVNARIMRDGKEYTIAGAYAACK